MNRHFILQFKISIEVVLSVFKLFPIPHDNQLELHCSTLTTKEAFLRLQVYHKVRRGSV